MPVCTQTSHTRHRNPTGFPSRPTQDRTTYSYSHIDTRIFNDWPFWSLGGHFLGHFSFKYRNHSLFLLYLQEEGCPPHNGQPGLLCRDCKESRLGKREQYRVGTNIAWGTNCPNPLARPSPGIKEAMASTAALGRSPKRLWKNGVRGLALQMATEPFTNFPGPMLRLLSDIWSFFCKHYQQKNGHVTAKHRGICWNERKAVPHTTPELPREDLRTEECFSQERTENSRRKITPKLSMVEKTLTPTPTATCGAFPRDSFLFHAARSGKATPEQPGATTSLCPWVYFSCLGTTHSPTLYNSESSQDYS